jgi:tetratricopeptide (TPR) repeat protein
MSRLLSKTSSRRAAARAAILEARGDVAGAEKIYNDVLKENECDVRAMKGLIACARSKGAMEDARDALIAYVETFGADADAWYELGTIYAECAAYDECLFCYEEVLLAAPHSAEAHRRVAEVLYTMGGETRVREAKNHFAAALDFTTGKDVRALYGVVLCAKALRRMKASSSSSSAAAAAASSSSKKDDDDTQSDEDVDGAALADAAVERLLQRYAAEHESLLAVVRPQLRGALA